MDGENKVSGEAEQESNLYAEFMSIGISDDEEEAGRIGDSRNIMTVTQLTDYIKNIYECSPRLCDVYVTGELSNFKNHSSGHMYFTLKDKDSVLNSVMFRGYSSKLKFMPENGMSAVAHGYIGMYARSGQHMLYCDSIEPLGMGSLYFAFEQLKKKLNAEGLFREDIKKRLPAIPSAIGIVTSPTGAAVRDMINIFARRFPYARLTIFPALVQGTEAAAQIIEGINYFNRFSVCDLIIIGRGGGSIEDLWAFNDESLARCIRGSDIPIISAVGHEIDFTISDFASDRRAPTPSAAAEIAVPDAVELSHKLDAAMSRMTASLVQTLKSRRQRLEKSEQSRIMRMPSAVTDEKHMLLDNISMRLMNAGKLIMTQKMSIYRETASRLNSLNPLAVISRGYTAVFAEDGSMIRSTEDIGIGEKFNLRLTDGIIKGEVISKEKIKSEK